MNALLQDLRYGARMLLKQPGFTLIAVVTLALGIGANTAIFSVVNAVVLRPLPYQEPERLVMLWGTNAKDGKQQQPASFAEFNDWKTQARSFNALGASLLWNFLLARRLVERGVRFVQLHHESWDQHGSLVKDIKQNCLDTDQACAALIKDLKQREMLKDTLVVWGGEFGRTPMVQGGGDDGRDHHPNAFTMWLAGGGIKAGQTIGATDELGFNVIEDRVHVYDLHATLLHLLGFDHEKLTYRFHGRDFRLTDVQGVLVDKLLA